MNPAVPSFRHWSSMLSNFCPLMVTSANRSPRFGGTGSTLSIWVSPTTFTVTGIMSSARAAAGASELASARLKTTLKRRIVVPPRTVAPDGGLDSRGMLQLGGVPLVASGHAEGLDAAPAVCSPEPPSADPEAEPGQLAHHVDGREGLGVSIPSKGARSRETAAVCDI